MRRLRAQEAYASHRAAFELREDGRLGTTLAKKFLNLSAVTRSAPPKDEPVIGSPFLCTWIDNTVYLLDRVLPKQQRSFGFAEGVGTELAAFVGNGVFVGDNYVVGIGSTSDSPVGAAKLAPILMRVPGTPKIVDTAMYAAATPAERKRMSVLLPTVEVADFRGCYVVPLGWKNQDERYAFALVASTTEVRTEDPFAFAPLVRTITKPKIWIGHTGTMALTELHDDLGLDWSWGLAGTNTNDTIITGPVTCTGRGRLEFLMLKPESNTYSVTQTTHGVADFGYMYGTTPLIETMYDVAIPAGFPARNYVLSPTPTFPGYDGPGVVYDLPPGESTFLAGGNINVPLKYASNYTAVPRRASVWLARSNDFGVSWSLKNEPSIESTSIELPVTGWGSTGPTPDFPAVGIVGTVALLAGKFGHMRVVEYAGAGTLEYPTEHGTETFNFSNYSQRLARGSYTPLPPAPPSTGNRGPVHRGFYESFLLVNAGSTTFAVVPEYLDAPLGEPGLAAVRDLNDTLNSEAEPRAQNTMVQLPQPRYTLRMFRRMGDSDFVRTPWPGDAMAGVSMPSHLVADTISNAYAQDPVRRCAAGWLSLGEGRAAFLLVQRDASSPYTNTSSTAVAIGTVDGGNNWMTIELGSADEFRQWGVIGADSIEKHPTILFSRKAGAVRQLMRISADFTKVTAYGKEYPAGRGGLVNFRKHVHPAFPTEYDEPTS